MTVTPSRAPAPAAPAWSTDPYAAALWHGTGPLFLRRTDGWLLPLEVERWCARPDAADRSVLRRCRGGVLDIGCGPGRMVADLARRGRRALGIDVTQAAVDLTRRRGGTARLASVFEPLPGEGRWHSTLLLDGNVGIGGEPEALLHRLRQVTAPGGRLLAEAAPAEVDERVEACLTDGRGRSGPPFAWARLGPAALTACAARADWWVADRWAVRDRSFVELRAAR